MTISVLKSKKGYEQDHNDRDIDYETEIQKAL